jgi:hypothetical protein
VLSSSPAALLQGKQTLVPLRLEAGWTPEQVWKLWRREKSLASDRNRTLGVQLVAYSLYRLSYPGSIELLMIFFYEAKLTRS